MTREFDALEVRLSMILYHGSNVIVENPQIIVSNRSLDFGPGFYATSDREQAEKWAKIQTKRRRKGNPELSIFEFDEKKIEKLDVLQFDGPQREWLDFVTQNRKGVYAGDKFDIVIGPVANDTTMTVLSEYMAGNITEEIALILLKPQKLANQYTFLTEKGLSCLDFIGGEGV